MGSIRPALPVGPRPSGPGVRAPLPKAVPTSVPARSPLGAATVARPPGAVSTAKRPAPDGLEQAAGAAAAKKRLRPWKKKEEKEAIKQAVFKAVGPVGGPHAGAGGAPPQAADAASAAALLAARKKWPKTKWSKASIKAWKAAGGGGAAGPVVAGGTAAGRRAGQELAQKLKGGDLAGAIDAAKRCAQGGSGPMASQVMPKLLEMAARKAGPAQYAEVLALCMELNMQLDVNSFTKLVVLLTSRIPVPTGMVRLTLNLALPADGQVVPLVPPDATEEDERAVFEDGEQMAAGDERAPRAAPPVAPSKELGPRPQVRDEQEVSEARLAMTKIDPASLRGCMFSRDDATGAYFGHFSALLHLETLVELRALKRRLSRPVDELERFGFMVRGLQVRMAETRSVGKGKSGGLPGRETGTKRARVVFALPRGLDLSRFRFRSGDSVLLSQSDPLTDLKAEGIVADAPDIEGDGPGGGRRGDWEERITVTYDGTFDEEAGKRGEWRLDRAANRTAYERQLMALVRMATAKDEKRIALWDILPLTGVGGENVDAWASKMKAMLDDKQKASLESGVDTGEGGAQSAQAGDQRELRPEEMALQQLCAEEPPLPNPHALAQVRGRIRQGGAQSLNPSQREAVAAALGRRLTLVQGPPGTGKTTVSVQLLGHWARDLRVKPLLATSDSNIAVDNIAEGVQGLGLKVVRVGRPEKVTSHLEDITLESILRKKLEGKGSREEGDRGKGSGKGGKKGGGDSAEAKQRRVDEFEAKMAILREADVVCTTTIAAGSDFLHLLKCQAILIDEVAQATELSAIVPIALRGAERLVLVGDHCQLPPSVCSLEAETRGLSLSVFGRLAAQGLDPYFLDTQFRMHPMIASFSAQEFYHGRLRTGVNPASRPPPQGFEWPQAGSGIAFVHVDVPEQRDGESRTNAGEAETVMEILLKVLACRELSVLEVGIVSPYSAQVRALRQLLRRELPMRLRGTGVDLHGGLEGRRGPRALEIASVDAFQGREKELIIFSAVRSNRFGNVGFLADWRRLNVMITRARRGLIIIGNTGTLRGDPIWGKWLQWAEANGLVVGAQAIGRYEAPPMPPPQAMGRFGGGRPPPMAQARDPPPMAPDRPREYYNPRGGNYAANRDRRRSRSRSGDRGRRDRRDAYRDRRRSRSRSRRDRRDSYRDRRRSPSRSRRSRSRSGNRTRNRDQQQFQSKWDVRVAAQDPHAGSDFGAEAQAQAAAEQAAAAAAAAWAPASYPQMAPWGMGGCWPSACAAGWPATACAGGGCAGVSELDAAEAAAAEARVVDVDAWQAPPGYGQPPEAAPQYPPTWQ